MVHSTLVRASNRIDAANAEKSTGAPVCDSTEQHSCINKKSENSVTEQDDDAVNNNIRYETPEIEWCRRRPTWRTVGTQGSAEKNEEIIRETCQRVLAYKPDPEELTDQDHWVNTDHQYLSVLKRPIFQKLATCLEEKMNNSIANNPTESKNTVMKKPFLSKLHRRSNGLPVMAIVEDALAENEAEAVLALATCLQKEIPDTFEKRIFEYTHEGSEGGGNDVTYMAGFLQLLLPGVAHSIQQTAKLVWLEAGWSEESRVFEPIDAEYDDNEQKILSKYSSRWWPDPVSECGIRTTEHLSYDRWKGLGFHEDGESDYTVLVALSDPSDYQGGAFSLCPEYDPDSDSDDDSGGPGCRDKISIRPKQYSAIVFLSEYSHGVEEILTPGRVMFTNELWRYGDIPCMAQRPTPSYHVLGYDEDDEDEDENDDYNEDEEEEQEFY